MAPDEVFIVTTASPCVISSAADEPPPPALFVHDKTPEASVFNT